MQHKTETLDFSAYDKKVLTSVEKAVVKKNRTISIFLIFPAFLISYLLLQGQFIFLMPWAWIILYVLSVKFGLIKPRKKIDQLERFAKDNELIYRVDEDYVAEGIIFKIGDEDEQKTGPRVSLNFRGVDTDMYLHSFEVGSGRSRTRISYAVSELKLSKQVPHIFIDYLENNFFNSEQMDMFKEKYRMNLEGDFHKFFNVFAVTDYEPEVLTIVDPAFMYNLIKTHVDYEIEFVEDRVFLYFKCLCRGSIDEIDLKQAIARTELIVETLKQQVESSRFKEHPKVPSRMDISFAKKHLGV